MTALTVVPDKVTFTGEIHPYADRFPMLDDESLDALAADIRANGLLHPIVLTTAGVLLDGRNRLAACDRAGVAPAFCVFDGDPIAFVIGQNMQRRDLTQAQKAHLAVAGLFESNNALRQEDISQIAGVSRPVIAQAMVVRRFSPADAVACENGAPHDPAYQRAKAAKEAIALWESRRAELDRVAPDLLAKGLTDEEAWGAHQERTRKEREAETHRAEARRRLNADVNTAVHCLAGLACSPERTEQSTQQIDPDAGVMPITAALLDEAERSLALLRQLIPTHKRGPKR